MRPSLTLLFLLAGCGGSATTTHDSPTASESTGSEASPVSEAAPDSPPVATLPPTTAPAHGESAFGVYLARVEDPAEATAWMDRLRERGVDNAGSGELSCDLGAGEALSLPEETIVVSIAFATRAEAELFVEGWGDPVLGIAEFVAYCRD